ncbi:MAG TPA: hypothetical protein DCL69_07885 [Firmicutes bacterium]|nr:hypothetical protein [Bacillota bacterium]
MKTRMVQSCIGLLLVVSIMLVLSGCLTLYTCKLEGFSVSDDGNTITVNYRFKNSGKNTINGYTVFALVKCKDKKTDANYTFNDRHSFENTIAPGGEVTSSYFIAFKEEDRGPYTVTDVEITETSLTIYK